MSRDRTVDLENGYDRTRRERVTYEYIVRRIALEQTQKVPPQAQKVPLSWSPSRQLAHPRSVL